MAPELSPGSGVVPGGAVAVTTECIKLLFGDHSDLRGVDRALLLPFDPPLVPGSEVGGTRGVPVESSSIYVSRMGGGDEGDNRTARVLAADLAIRC